MDNNSAKGRTSFDITTGNVLVNFFNRNTTEYPTEVSSPKFDLVPVTKQKDIMLNAARMYAQQEYNRIMELVTVLQKQAEELKRRLDITDAIYSAEYSFKIYPGVVYWLLYDTKKNITRLSTLGPNDWSTGYPDYYEYISKVKCLGDNTWVEIEEKL